MVTIDNYTGSSYVMIDFPARVRVTTCHTVTNSIVTHDRHGATINHKTVITRGHARHSADGCASRREKH